MCKLSAPWHQQDKIFAQCLISQMFGYLMSVLYHFFLQTTYILKLEPLVIRFHKGFLGHFTLNMNHQQTIRKDLFLFERQFWVSRTKCKQHIHGRLPILVLTKSPLEYEQSWEDGEFDAYSATDPGPLNSQTIKHMFICNSFCSN